MWPGVCSGRKVEEALLGFLTTEKLAGGGLDHDQKDKGRTLGAMEGGRKETRAEENI